MSKMNMTRSLVLTFSIFAGSLSHASGLACIVDLQQKIQQELEAKKDVSAGSVAKVAGFGMSAGAGAGAFAGAATAVPPMIIVGITVGGVGGLSAGALGGASASVDGMTTELSDIPLHVAAQRMIELMDVKSEAHAQEVAELKKRVPSLTSEVASASIQKSSLIMMNQSRCGISLESELTTANLASRYLATLSQVIQ